MSASSAAVFMSGGALGMNRAADRIPRMLAAQCFQSSVRLGMGLLYLVAHGVRIHSREDVHVERATAGDQGSEGIRGAQRRAPMVQRDVGRVVRDDAARAQGGGVGVQAAEVVQPERRIEAAG